MPTRKSSRLQNKASSRASSVAAEDRNNDNEAVVSTAGLTQGAEMQQLLPSAMAKTKNKSKSKSDFDADLHVDYLIKYCDEPVSQTLTKAQLTEIITKFAGRYRTLLGEHDEQKLVIDKVTKERDHSRETSNIMRKDRLTRQIHHEQMKAEKKKAEDEEAKKKAAEEKEGEEAVSEDAADDEDIVCAADQEAPAYTHNPANDMDVDLAGETSNALSVPPPTDASPAEDSHNTSLQTPATKSFFSRILGPLGSYFSPTPVKSKQPAPTFKQPQLPSQQSQPQQPLGKLPTSRKRPAPDTEVTEPAKTQRSAPAAPLTTSTPKAKRNPVPRANKPINPMIPDSLETINEQMEPERSTHRTPARAPAPTPSRRSIQQVRSQRVQKQMQLDKTPARAWERITHPRLSNADERLRKLQMYDDLKKRQKELEDDQELQDILEQRPSKRMRINVDDAAYVPHRAPGDPQSTFRMPEVDSDGEMEVDEDIEMKKNIFEASQAEETPTRSPARKPVREVLPAVEIEEIAWAFPSVGLRPVGEEDDFDPYLAKKFDYGFESWKRGERLVEW